jgi:hypothetical protein
MTNRREFLQIGVSAAAWPFVARAAEAGGALEPPAWIPVSMAVFDTRFSESAAFAARSATLGVSTRAIDADMTRLWFDEIHHRWKAAPAAIAGLTGYGPMFCFAELARDVRMRLVFRARHRRQDPGGMAHAFTGPVSMLPAAAAVCATEPFGAGMADVVSRCPRGRVEIGSTGAGLLDDDPDAEALYTWLIAPAVPVQA